MFLSIMYLKRDVGNVQGVGRGASTTEDNGAVWQRDSIQYVPDVLDTPRRQKSFLSEKYK